MHKPHWLIQTGAFYHAHKHYVPAATFLGGCLFDICTLEGIDHWKPMALLGFYLVVVLILTTLEIVDAERPLPRAGRLGRLWEHHIEAVHFFLGNLLSAFTVFYFKSASLLPSLIFFLLIAGLLFANESHALRRLGIVVRAMMLAVVLTSYLACVTPVWWGHLGYLPFLTSIATSALIFAGILFAAGRTVADRRFLLRRLAAPYGATLVVFLGFYALHLIPPVPLTLTKIAVYHDVEHDKQGGYLVKTERPRWKFWQHGDQVFIARPGDKIFVFFSIFSPTGFHERVRVRWLYKDEKEGWTPNGDGVSIATSGGREAGYRAFATKANYRPGDWQVRIETSDEREIGRIGLTVDAPEPGAPSAEMRVETL